MNAPFPLPFRACLAVLGLCCVAFLPIAGADKALKFQHLSCRIDLLRIPENWSDKATLKFQEDIARICSGHLAKATRKEELEIIAVVKPGRQMRVWFVSAPDAPARLDLPGLKKKLEAMEAPPVDSGMAVLGLSGTVQGEGDPTKSELPKTRLPQEWLDAAKAAHLAKPIEDAMDYLPLVWPDTPAK